LKTRMGAAAHSDDPSHHQQGAARGCRESAPFLPLPGLGLTPLPPCHLQGLRGRDKRAREVSKPVQAHKLDPSILALRTQGPWGSHAGLSGCLEYLFLRVGHLGGSGLLEDWKMDSSLVCLNLVHPQNTACPRGCRMWLGWVLLLPAL
jgi:hypothetical protein